MKYSTKNFKLKPAVSEISALKQTTLQQIIHEVFSIKDQQKDIIHIFSRARSTAVVLQHPNIVYYMKPENFLVVNYSTEVSSKIKWQLDKLIHKTYL